MGVLILWGPRVCFASRRAAKRPLAPKLDGRRRSVLPGAKLEDEAPGVRWRPGATPMMNVLPEELSVRVQPGELQRLFECPVDEPVHLLEEVVEECGGVQPSELTLGEHGIDEDELRADFGERGIPRSCRFQTSELRHHRSATDPIPQRSPSWG